jgi:TonB family protein
MAGTLLYQCLMTNFAFAQPSASGLPRRSRWTYGMAAVIHILLFALVIHIRTQPRRVNSAGSPYGSMTAYVAGSIAAGQAAAPSKPVEPKKNALTTKVAKAVPKDDQAGAATSAGSAGAAGGQAGTGPVRLGTGGNLTLIKKVTPIYPTLMQSARMTGQVVLDAIIHPDGTIGDVTVLRSTNDAFTQSAIAAVKQWRYTAPGFEGILTVSVNFTLAA